MLLTDLVYNAPIAEVGTMAWEYRPCTTTSHFIYSEESGDYKNHFIDSQQRETSFTDEGACIVTETSNLL